MNDIQTNHIAEPAPSKKGPLKKVITYGSFDLFHEGHYRLLERAKALGD